MTRHLQQALAIAASPFLMAALFLVLDTKRTRRWCVTFGCGVVLGILLTGCGFGDADMAYHDYLYGKGGLEKADR